MKDEIKKTQDSEAEIVKRVVSIEKKLDHVHTRVAGIEEGVAELNKRIGAKWILPISLALLAAVLGSANYLIEKNIDRNYLTDLKKKELFAEFEAKSEIAFYTEAREKIIKLNDLFEEFCKFKDKETGGKLDQALIDYRNFYQKQQFIEFEIINDLKKYSEFLAESQFEIEKSELGRKEIERLFEDSQKLKVLAVKRVNDGLNKLN